MVNTHRWTAESSTQPGGDGHGDSVNSITGHEVHRSEVPLIASLCASVPTHASSLSHREVFQPSSCDLLART